MGMCGYNNCHLQAFEGAAQKRVWNASGQAPKVWQKDLVGQLTATSNSQVNWKNGVYLARDLSEILLSAVMNGSIAVLTPKSVGGFFPTDITKFKQSWWTGGA